MGYSTYFTLNKIQGSDEDFDAFVKDIDEKSGVNFTDDAGQSAKWYDHHEDMTEVSRKYPDLTVQLDGEGEDSEDVWATRYRGGESESVGYEQEPFCALASRTERVSYLAKTYADARKRFIRLIACIIGEQPLHEMSTDIVLEDDGSAVSRVDRVFVRDGEVWYHHVIEHRDPAPDLSSDCLMDAEGTLQEIYLIAQGVMKIQQA